MEKTLLTFQGNSFFFPYVNLQFLCSRYLIFMQNGHSFQTLCKYIEFQGILSKSSSIAKLVVSSEAGNSLNHAKVQLLLILIETLDLDNLLLLVHDEVPFR